MVACFRLGYVVLPCTEQLRAKDLRLRLDVARPALVVADERNRERSRARRLGRARSLYGAPTTRCYAAEPAPPRRARPPRTRA